jgi:glycosyltransferase involved in cell wall biosynthesis
LADRLPSISAFFPCYNDAGSIVMMVEKVAGALRTVTDDWEVVVVDDGSADDSVAVLEAMQVRAPYLRIVKHGVNRGYGAALRSGFQAATREYVFYTDGDGQYDPEELPLLVRAMSPAIGLVNGYKLRRADPFHRVLIGRTYQFVARRLFSITLRDVDCDFRLIRTDYLRRISLSFESGAIGVELVRRLQGAGCAMVEVGVHHYPRLHGRSEFFRFRHVANLVSDLWRLWWKLRDERRATFPADGDTPVLSGAARGEDRVP